MKTIHGAAATLFAAILTAALCLGQAPAARKSYTFHGTVVSVNKDTQRLAVNGEKVDGWMRAMTMNYKVDDPSIIAKLKPGDRITATVYDGDQVVLHNVTAAGPASGPTPSTRPPVAVPSARWDYDYRIPRQNVAPFLQAQPFNTCQLVNGIDVVSCNRIAAGSFGQVRIDNEGKPYVNGRPQPPPSYPIPSTPPPAGVAPAQQAQAEQIWNRAVDLLNRNDAKDSMPVLYQCALMGDKRCEATLGIRYQDGDGIKADDHAAAYWFGLAVAQGHRASQYALAGMYQEGEGGLPKDDGKATELMIKSANQGYFKAQYALAFQYEIGDGVPRSRQKAIELFRASGDGIGIANVLADPKAPARFADMTAFARYLASLRNLEEAASWQQYLNTLPKNGGGCHDAGCALHNFNMEHWKNSGGIDSGKPRPN
jgi:Cu/Ag efflux protein CusF